MSKARDLADLVAAGGTLADGLISVSEISDLTVTAEELNNVTGINSSVQDQLDTKAPLASPVFTGEVTIPDALITTLNLGGTDVTATAAQLNGLGTASQLDVGTSANNVVQLDGAAKLPAVDGSQLTNIQGYSIATAMAYGNALS